MKIKQLFHFYKNKKDIDCPLTEALMRGGYLQAKGTGYRQEQIDDMPSQYIHLMNYCEGQIRDGKNKDFPKSITCGELIFWMAEASNALSYEELDKLKDEILDKYKYDRIGGNKKIQNICFDKIISLIEVKMSHK